MRRILFALLACLLLLTSCAQEKPAVGLDGTWEGEMSMKTAVNQAMEKMFLNMAPLESFPVTVRYTFDAHERTYKVEADADAFRASLEAALRAGYERMLAETGSDSTVDDMLTASSTDLAEITEQVIEAGGLLSYLSDEGFYYTEEGRLHFTAEDTLVDESFHITYEVSADTLTFSGAYIEDIEDEEISLLADMYPIYLSRAE